MSPLSPVQRQVLSMVYDYGMLRGRDLNRNLKILDVATLRTVLTSLAEQKLVTIQSGSLAFESERGVLDAYIAPLPSGQAMASIALKS